MKAFASFGGSLANDYAVGSSVLAMVFRFHAGNSWVLHQLQ